MQGTAQRDGQSYPGAITMHRRKTRRATITELIAAARTRLPYSRATSVSLLPSCKRSPSKGRANPISWHNGSRR